LVGGVGRGDKRLLLVGDDPFDPTLDALEPSVDTEIRGWPQVTEMVLQVNDYGLTG
jgi:hypothetical protein